LSRIKGYGPGPCKLKRASRRLNRFLLNKESEVLISIVDEEVGKEEEEGGGAATSRKTGSGRDDFCCFSPVATESSDKRPPPPPPLPAVSANGLGILKPVLFLLSVVNAMPIFKLEDGTPPKLLRLKGREEEEEEEEVGGGIASKELPLIALTRGVKPPNGFLENPPPPPPPPVNENDEEDEDEDEDEDEEEEDMGVFDNDFPPPISALGTAADVSISATSSKAFAFSNASAVTVTALFLPVVNPVKTDDDDEDEDDELEVKVVESSGFVTFDKVFVEMREGGMGVVGFWTIGTATREVEEDTSASARSSSCLAFSRAEAESTIGLFRPVVNPSKAGAEDVVVTGTDGRRGSASAGAETFRGGSEGGSGGGKGEEGSSEGGGARVCDGERGGCGCGCCCGRGGGAESDKKAGGSSIAFTLKEYSETTRPSSSLVVVVIAAAAPIMIDEAPFSFSFSPLGSV